MKKIRIFTSVLIISALLLVVAIGMGTANALTANERLGKSIFLIKTSLSIKINPVQPAIHERLDGLDLMRQSMLTELSMRVQFLDGLAIASHLHQHTPL